MPADGQRLREVDVAIAIAHDVGLIVGAALKRQPLVVIDTWHLRRVVELVVDAPVLGDETARDAPHDLLLGDIEHEHAVECSSTLDQHLVKRDGLWHGAWKSVEQEPTRGIRFGDALTKHPHDEIVGDELARIHVALGFDAEGRVALHVRAQHVSGRDVRHREPRSETWGLRALARSGRAEDEIRAGHCYFRKPS